MNDTLKIAKEISNDIIAQLLLTGEINRYSVEKLRILLVHMAEHGPKTVILFMDDITLIDSSGVGLLISVKKLFKDHSNYLVIKNTPKRIREIFQLLKVHDALIYDI